MSSKTLDLKSIGPVGFCCLASVAWQREGVVRSGAILISSVCVLIRNEVGRSAAECADMKDLVSNPSKTGAVVRLEPAAVSSRRIDNLYCVCLQVGKLSLDSW